MQRDYAYDDYSQLQPVRTHIDIAIQRPRVAIEIGGHAAGHFAGVTCADRGRPGLQMEITVRARRWCLDRSRTLDHHRNCR